jgi:hypothetical protein
VAVTDHAVVVAGGGPTGLMLAGELALAGVDVVIVERRAGQEVDGSRAGGLYPRTLEELDQRGIAERFISAGRQHPALGYAQTMLDISDVPTRHNYVLALWQSEFEPILAAMGEKISHMGEVGSGARMKLINNLIMGANMAVLSEGLALGEAAGIPVEKQLEVILAGSAASGVAQRRSGNLISRSYEPQFKLSHELKDLYYALELGRDLEDPLPITAVVSQIYNEGMREHAEDDMSAVAEVYRQRVNARPA